jgi:polar amino acid transport system substrate-binding protein
VTEAAAPATGTAPAAASAATDLPVRMVTGNGYAPYSDEMLPGGGMFTQLVEMAIFRADPAIPYNLAFISDWQAHIDALLPSQAYDLSFPWVRPDCSASMLSPGDQARCDDFVFSAPFHEVVDGFFAPAGSDLIRATDYAAFKGKRICRPEGYTTGVLDDVGLGASEAQLMRPIEVTDCFEALASGKVDLVSIDAEVGDAAIAQLDMVGDFAQNPHLVTLQSLHVIAHKSNPRAVEMIVQLDSGLVEMYESGEWYDIVSTALSQNNLRQ